MEVFKLRAFARWAKQAGMSDADLLNTVNEMTHGLVGAEIGGHLFKKRVALGGKGKRGGARTLVCFRAGDRAIFLHGFAKNEHANISANELLALRKLAGVLVKQDQQQIWQACNAGELLPVSAHEGDL